LAGESLHADAVLTSVCELLDQPGVGRQAGKIERLVVRCNLVQPARIEPATGGFVQSNRGIETVAERSSFKGESLSSGGFDPVGIRLSGFRDEPVNDQRELTQRNRWRLMQYGLGSHLERNRAGNTARRDDPELMPPGRRVGPESDLQPGL